MNRIRVGLIIAVIVPCAIAIVGSPQQDRSEHPSGVISGRIVDDEGRPMRGIHVQALAAGFRNGRLDFTSRGNIAETNDRGEFRLFWLEPGAYYIAVDPTPIPDPTRLQGGRPPSQYLPSDPDAMFVPTYFPGTSDVREAESVDVGSGETEIHSIQVATLPMRVIRVRIPPERVGDAFYRLPLLSLRSIDGRPLSLNFPRAVGYGQFEVRTGLAAGQYGLSFSVRAPDGMHAGGATVRIDGTDPGVVEIALSRAIPVQGQVLTDGAMSSLTVICIPDQHHVSGFETSDEVRANGRFLLEDIMPGAYSIRIDGLKNDAYVADMRLQDEQVSPVKVEFPAGLQPLRLSIQVRQDGGSVHGVVVDDTRTAVRGVVVALLPSEAFQTVTNRQGEFEFRGIPPGSYTLIVAKERRTPVTVAPGSRIDLGPIPVLK